MNTLQYAKKSVGLLPTPVLNFYTAPETSQICLCLRCQNTLKCTHLNGFQSFFSLFVTSVNKFSYYSTINTCNLQDCGLSLDVSVSRRSWDVPTSRLGLVSRKNVNVSVSSRSREADVTVSSRYRPLRLVPKTNFRPNCTGHSTQCERALDVVSHAVVTIAHHINALKTMNVKDNI